MNLPDCRPNNFTLYVHIAPNGKQYFGITSKAVTRRWSDGEGYKNNNHFYNAIKKYGWTNFQHIVISNSLSKELALFLEKYFIEKYKTFNMKFGYNRAIGGDWGGYGYRWSQSDVVKKHISDVRKGMKFSKTHKQHLKESWVNRKISGKGEPWNRGVKLKETGMIDSFIAAGKENAKKQRRAVYQLDMEDNILNKFESVTAAAKYIGVSYSSGIFAVLSGRERTAHGYRWKYVSDKSSEYVRMGGSGK